MDPSWSSAHHKHPHHHHLFEEEEKEKDAVSPPSPGHHHDDHPEQQQPHHDHRPHHHEHHLHHHPHVYPHHEYEHHHHDHHEFESFQGGSRRQHYEETFDENGNLILGSSINSNNSNEEHGFCRPGMSGGGMIMYMDGFRFSLLGGTNKNQPCLNLLVPGWTLDSYWKFGFAAVGVFALAVLVEGFSKLRHKVVRAAKEQRRRQRQSSSPRSFYRHPALLRLAVTSLHGLQALLGYILMLVAMTFSLELLLCVCCGLAVGYAVFFQSSAEEDDVVAHVTSNPCCEFMEEESREMQQASSYTPLTQGLLEGQRRTVV